MTTEKLVAGPLRGLLATWRKYIRREMDNEESAPAGDALVYCDAMRHCADELAEALASLPSSPPHDWHGHTPDGVWHGCPEHPGPVQGPKPHAGDCSCAECVNWCQNWMPTEPVAAPAELDLSWLGKLETRFLRDEHGREIRGALWVRRSEVAEHFTRDPSPVQGVQALTVGNVTGVLFNSGVGLTAAVAQKVTAELNAIAAGQRAEGAEAGVAFTEETLLKIDRNIPSEIEGRTYWAEFARLLNAYVLAAPPVAEKTELDQAGPHAGSQGTAPWPCLACGGDGGHREGCLGDLHLREQIERRKDTAALGSGQELREALVSELQEIGRALWSTNVQRGRQINGIAQRLAALALPLAPKVPPTPPPLCCDCDGLSDEDADCDCACHAERDGGK